MRTDLWVRMPNGWVNSSTVGHIRKKIGFFSETFCISIDGVSSSFESEKARDVKYEEISALLKATSVK